MRIRSISLQGFKSFGNRSRLEFHPGINVIAGPNGSGKSNVIDALRWATGGGRASEFRAAEKTELIFHGAAGRKGLGYAEVEIELEHESAPVTVQRTLLKDGSGRLKLNGHNARFIDIDEALSGSGLGKGSVAIIGQGEVSSVLMADPARLLNHVNEAVGVARLASRREQTEARLATASDHLDRLMDLHDELERQLSRLAEEAAAATEYAGLAREELQLRYSLARLRHESLEAGIRDLAAQEQDLLKQLAGLEQESSLRRAAAAQQRAETDRLQEEYRQATAAHEAWRGSLRLLDSRTEAESRRVRDLESRLGSFDVEIGLLEAAEPPEAPQGDGAALAAAAEAAEQAHEAARRKLADLQQSTRDADEQFARLMAREQETGYLLRTHAGRLESTRAQLAEATARLQTLENAATDSSLESAALEAAKLEAEASSRLEAVRQELTEAQQAHAAADAEFRARQGEAARLEQALAARRGYAQGPRTALQAGIPGVIGAVADLLNVPAEFRPAIGASLGRRGEYIVARDADTARKVIDHVRRAGGFVTVMPLDLLRRGPAPSGGLAGEPGVIGLAVELTDFDPDYADLFRQLFGSTTIVSDMTAAIALARRHRDRPRLVTLQGEMLDNSGAMSGGRAGSSVALGLAQEAEEAAAAAEEAGRHASHAREALLRLQDSTRQAQTELQERARAAAATTAAHSRQLQEEAGRAGQLEELRSRVNQLESAVMTLEQEELPEAPDGSEMDAARQTLQEARDRESEAAAEVATAAGNASAAARDVAVFRSEEQAYVRELQRWQSDRERLTELQASRTALQDSLTETRELEGRLRQEREELAAARPRDPEELNLELGRARQELTVKERLVQDAGTDAAGHQAALERVRLNAARRETMLEASLEELDSFPPGLVALSQSDRGMRQRLAEVTGRIADLGPINHRAAAEHEAEQLRARQLGADLLDARAAADELADSLQQVDDEANRRTEAAIVQVRDAFIRHATELFGGDASADIRVQREDGRPVGLIISLRPPGKHTTQLNLLSVGERTMGALAYLFALIGTGEGQGLPLAVLDEVDAPLDEANIGRFTDFVTRLARRGTQFLLISHQRTTFSVADAMWGVTSESGVSAVFSISRDAG